MYSTCESSFQMTSVSKTEKSNGTAPRKHESILLSLGWAVVEKLCIFCGRGADPLEVSPCRAACVRRESSLVIGSSVQQLALPWTSCREHKVKGQENKVTELTQKLAMAAGKFPGLDFAQLFHTCGNRLAMDFSLFLSAAGCIGPRQNRVLRA